jgi:hypothetical protein
MKHQLVPEDAQRMHRLSEEVRGRLEEMALIATRKLGVSADPKALTKFAPKNPSTRLGCLGLVEILDASSDHPEICVLFFCDGSVGLESPCGSG